MRPSSRCSLLALALLAACGGSATDSGTITTTGTVTNGTFNTSPLVLDQVSSIIPLGNMLPPDQVLPADHVSFVIAGTSGATAGRTVVAPGKGTVEKVGSNRITIASGGAIHYWLQNITLLSTLSVGTAITEGQTLGTTTGKNDMLDFGVYSDLVAVRNLLSPGRYAFETLHAIAPLPLFGDPSKSYLSAKVKSSVDQNGKLDWDQTNKLVGNWFSSSLPQDASSTVAAANPKQVAFGYDAVSTGQVRISIGGQLSITGLFAPSGDDPTPDAVNFSTGKVLYTLYPPVNKPDRTAIGYLLVQMETPTQIRVETFAVRPATLAFTTAAQVYVR
ncbi:MAG: hypothetical protein JWO05_70 [Gemmatimonadetes bacterium]|nr:hypothetical protein [Gemmatimonadota bacterium]